MKTTFKLLILILCSASQILAQNTAKLSNQGVVYHERIEVAPGLTEEVYISERFTGNRWEIQIDIVIHGSPDYLEGLTNMNTELIIHNHWDQHMSRDMTLNLLSSWVLHREIAKPSSYDLLEKSSGNFTEPNTKYLTSLFAPQDYNRELSGVLSDIPIGFGPRVRIF